MHLELTPSHAERSEAEFRLQPAGHGRSGVPTNFQNALRTETRHLEGLFPHHASILNTTVRTDLEAVGTGR